MEEFRQAGLWENTVIVVVADQLGPTVQSKRAATSHALRSKTAEKPEET